MHPKDIDDARNDLMQMGFDRASADKALAVCDNDKSRAVEYLLSGTGAETPPPALIEDVTNQQVQVIPPAAEHKPAQSLLGDVPVSPLRTETLKPLYSSVAAQKPDTTMSAYDKSKSIVPYEDTDLDRAIYASLNESPDHYLSDPHDRMRKEGCPVGLQNVGNTCYFASLIQTYFHIPRLRAAVLSYESNFDPEKENDVPMDKTERRAAYNARFVRELQRIFALLLKSEQAYVDPSALVRAVVDDEGKQLDMSAQQDVGEFHLFLLERMSEGLYPDAGNKRLSVLSGSLNPNRDLVTSLFHGVQIDTLHHDDSTTEIRSGFGALYLNISEKHTHSALDEYVGPTVVEYDPEPGRTVKATKQVVFDVLPPVLVIQLQRVQFDKNVKNAVKLMTEFKFDREMDMYRYTVDAESEYRARRQRVDVLVTERKKLEAELECLTNYKGKHVSLNIALEACIEHVRDSHTVHVLQQCLDEVNVEMATLTSSIDDTLHHICDMYRGMCGRPYTLHSILMHSGTSPNSGHYWAYIHDRVSDTWKQFNDSHVTDVDADTVFLSAFGGNDQASSAYCLTYVRADVHDVDETPMSTAILQTIEQDNTRYRNECEGYKNRQKMAELKQQAEVFHSKFWKEYNAVARDVKAMIDKDGLIPTNMSSFINYLIADDHYQSDNYSKYLTCDKLFRDEFGKSIDSARDEPFTRAVDAEFEPYPVYNTLFFRDVVLKDVYEMTYMQWRGVIDTGEYMVAAMEALLDRHYGDALLYTTNAVATQRPYRHTMLEDLTSLLSVAVKVWGDQLAEALDTATTLDATTIVLEQLQQLVNGICIGLKRLNTTYFDEIADQWMNHFKTVNDRTGIDGLLRLRHSLGYPRALRPKHAELPNRITKDIDKDATADDQFDMMIADESALRDRLLELRERVSEEFGDDIKAISDIVANAQRYGWSYPYSNYNYSGM